ncbi:MAG TPA: hypothetical protein VFT74_16545 [Isosphaeraceae bacterium]|nr:hypothetical protein [Isosphaeraceae bacterium]
MPLFLAFDFWEAVLRQLLRPLALVLCLGLGLAIQWAYQRVRRPGWAEYWGNLRISAGRVILVLLLSPLVFVIGMLVYELWGSFGH